MMKIWTKTRNVIVKACQKIGGLFKKKNKKVAKKVKK